jgi:hypothetical protein
MFTYDSIMTTLTALDPVVEGMLKALHAGNSIPDSVAAIYIPHIEQETRPAAYDRFATTTAKTVGAFLPPVAAAVEVAKALRDESHWQRALARYLSMVSGLAMLRRAALLDKSSAIRSFILQSAMMEFERARSLSTHDSIRDTFAIALLQAFTASSMENARAAADFSHPVLSYLKLVVAESDEVIRELEEDADVAQRALDTVRASFSDEQMNESYAKLELGLIASSEYPSPFSAEPAKVMAYGQAQLGEVLIKLTEPQRRRMLYVATIKQLTSLSAP